MIFSIEELKSVKKIVSHAPCADGIVSAMILKDALPEAEVVLLQYGTEEHAQLQAEPGLLFCDMSPPKARVQEFVEAGSFILDHHVTAVPAKEAGLKGVVDTAKEHSGATLAFEHVWQPVMGNQYVTHETKALADLVRVHDLWRTNDPDWRSALRLQKTLLFYPVSSWLDGRAVRMEPEFWEPRNTVGAIVLERELEAAKAAAQKADRFTHNGVRVVMFQGSSPLANDTAELLGPEADLIVSFRYVSAKDGHVGLAFSLRSHTGFNCAKLAEKFGGGGHEPAAGFNVKSCVLGGYTMDWNPFVVFRLILRENLR